jgi:hypothetical protein
MKIDKNTTCDLKDHVINRIKQIGFIRYMRCLTNNKQFAKIAK